MHRVIDFVKIKKDKGIKRGQISRYVYERDTREQKDIHTPPPSRPVCHAPAPHAGSPGGPAGLPAPPHARPNPPPAPPAAGLSLLRPSAHSVTHERYFQ